MSSIKAMGLEALKEAHNLALGAGASTAKDEDPKEPKKVVEQGMSPIIAPEYKPQIEVKTVGTAVAQAIAEDPIASKLPAAKQRDLAYAIYEQLKGNS